MTTAPPRNKRILIVDDNEDIHHDFRRILAPSVGASTLAELDALEACLLGGTPAPPQPPTFELTSAFQGAEALAKVQKALEDGTPYALAFIDVRMPPGWDGIETLTHLWQADSRLQAVICSAFSDYSWEDLSARLGQTDRLLILKKPFDAVEVRQMACALIERWNQGAQLALPLLSITDDIVVLPFIGPLGSERMRQAWETLAGGSERPRARIAILDVTGVPNLSREVAEGLVGIARAVRQTGTEVVLTGVRPELLKTLPGLGHEPGVTTYPTLPSGVAFAMEKHR